MAFYCYKNVWSPRTQGAIEKFIKMYIRGKDTYGFQHAYHQKQTSLIFKKHLFERQRDSDIETNIVIHTHIHIYRERKREKSHLLNQSPDAHNRWDWTQLMPGTNANLPYGFSVLPCGHSVTPLLPLTVGISTKLEPGGSGRKRIQVHW